MSLLSFDSPCEIVGVLEAPEGKSVPFILIRIKTPDNREKYLLKSGEGVSWEVFIQRLFPVKLFTCFRSIASQCVMQRVTCPWLEREESNTANWRRRLLSTAGLYIFIFILLKHLLQSWTLPQIIFQYLEEQVSWLQFYLVERWVAGIGKKCLLKM